MREIRRRLAGRGGQTTAPRFQIGSQWVGDGEPLYVIAEAGVNHENDLKVAMEMIEQAAAAGADAIKFQSYKASRLAAVHSPAYWDQSKEPANSQRELFSRYDRFGTNEYLLLAEHARKHNITFLTTVFDESFADDLADVLPAFKVASADITHHRLLKKLASKHKPVIMSVGAATVSEIDDAVRVLQDGGASDIALLHCVLNYPCPPRNANLAAISSLSQAFPDLVVGYSDHVPPDHGMLQLSLAAMLGASIVEKHFTLNKALPGNDHYHAMDPDDLRQFRQSQEYLELLLGDGKLGYSDTERAARQFARRSLVSAASISAGELVTEEMIDVKRPATGISPQYVNLVVGAKALIDIEADTTLQWEMFIQR